jgi:hypothetical protein
VCVLDAQPNPGEADIEAYIRNLVGCDIQGRDANGNCIRPNDQAGELVGTAAGSVNTANSQGSKSKSSGPPIGIIAGQSAAFVVRVFQADLMSHAPGPARLCRCGGDYRHYCGCRCQAQQQPSQPGGFHER